MGAAAWKEVVLPAVADAGTDAAMDAPAPPGIEARSSRRDVAASRL